MTETQRVPVTRLRQISWMAVCTAIVAISAFFDPLTGKCGTAPWLMFRIIGALLVDAIQPICSICEDRITQLHDAAGILVNVGVFSMTIAFLYVKGQEFLPTARGTVSTSRTWFVPALLTWTVFYLASYFFLFPTTSCP